MGVEETGFYWDEGVSLSWGWLCASPGWPWERVLCLDPGETEAEGISLVVTYEVSTER